MDSFLLWILQSWRYIVSTVAIYLLSLVFYRLTIHPLAKFPGSKLAAITRYYEAYYDVVQNGQYTFRIAKMHEKYGPIVRISPYELHVNDPTFFDKLYRQDVHYDKYDWTYDAFAATGATVFTAAHSVHKGRRIPLGPFFSKAKVASRQDMIRKHLDKLCNHLSKFAESGVSFNLGAATTAFVRDVSYDYILDKSYNSLDHEDFEVVLTRASQGAGQIWRLSKHLRGFGACMHALPIGLIMKIAGEDVKAFFRHIEETQQDTRNLMTAAISHAATDASRRTIVHEIMDSKLPPSEKEFKRVFEDVSTVAGAGFETTASALRLIFFHVFSNPLILHRLRAELADASIGNRARTGPLELRALEQLPYLTAILMEGMRLSPAIATRMARIAPPAGFTYEQWHIPAGTPVGMTLILMHMNEEVFPEPGTFDPERWVEPAARKRAERAYAPFSKGTRNCLGMNLAWAEMYMVLADFALRFDFEFPSANAGDFECESDQFAIGTRGKGVLKTVATIC